MAAPGRGAAFATLGRGLSGIADVLLQRQREEERERQRQRELEEAIRREEENERRAQERFERSYQLETAQLGAVPLSAVPQHQRTRYIEIGTTGIGIPIESTPLGRIEERKRTEAQANAALTRALTAKPGTPEHKAAIAEAIRLGFPPELFIERRGGSSFTIVTGRDGQQYVLDLSSGVARPVTTAAGEPLLKPPSEQERWEMMFPTRVSVLMSNGYSREEAEMVARDPVAYREAVGELATPTGRLSRRLFARPQPQPRDATSMSLTPATQQRLDALEDTLRKAGFRRRDR